MTLIPKGQLIVITQKLRIDNKNSLERLSNFGFHPAALDKNMVLPDVLNKKVMHILDKKKPFAKAFSNACIDFLGMIKIYSLDISFLNAISYLVLLY